MADEVDVLLHLFEEEREQARQSENQRATLSNIIILVVGAGLAFVTNRGFGKSTLAISIPMVVLGLYGALATAKFFERWYRHWRRAYAYREQLFEKFPDIDSKLRDYDDRATKDRGYKFEEAAEKRFPRLSRVKVNRLWVGLHVAIAVGGTVLSVVILVTN